MAFSSPTNPNNKSYLAITGNFTGTENEYFEVKVRDVANSEKWLWRYKSETPTVISNVTSDINIEVFLNIITSEFEKLQMSLPLILSCLLAICVLYIAGECCFRSGICAKYFLLFPQKSSYQRKLRQTKCLIFNF